MTTRWEVRSRSWLACEETRRLCDQLANEAADEEFEELLMATRISNAQARDFITELEDFQNTNKTLFGKTNKLGDYVVYSYGRHFPIYLWVASLGAWVANSDDYVKGDGCISKTTSRHKTVCRPIQEIHHWVNTEDLCHIIRYGYAEYAARRLTGQLERR